MSSPSYFQCRPFLQEKIYGCTLKHLPALTLVIYDAIQQIDMKCAVIERKVAKIYRAQGKQCWHSTNKHKEQDADFERSEDEEMEALERLNSFSHSESYSPTSPVRRPEINFDENIISPFNYEESEEMKQEIEEPLLQQEPFDGGSPIPTNCTGDAHCTCMRCASTPGSPKFPGNPSMLSAEVSMMSHSVPLTRRDTCLKHSLNENSLYGCWESKRIRTPFQNSTGFVTSSPIISNSDVLKQTLPEDPMHWSVEDVILFLNHADLQMSDLLAYLLRQHEIDGKALLLLNNDMIIKYMGLKLGPSLKLCHCIKKLKEEKSLSAFGNSH
ncbi:Sex comb on midleg-like protein 1 [Fukomys damarensis]|uniref:Sex comb on midleg-like protein 1 n=1 Tax=Fukomys damarensis TaxID=885580 RepID=A0A091D391_FUKDA|nr:Sex comb on midleg-like protein 1 [Fukomys damarensis]